MKFIQFLLAAALLSYSLLLLSEAALFNFSHVNFAQLVLAIALFLVSLLALSWLTYSSISLKVRMKIFTALTKIRHKKRGDLLEVFFDGFFESLDASILEASFYNLGATQSQVFLSVVGFTDAYLQSFSILFTHPSSALEPDALFFNPAEEVFNEAQSVAIAKLVEQGMTRQQAFALYSVCSSIALPRLSDFLRAQRHFFLDFSLSDDS